MADDGPIPSYIKARHPSTRFHENLLDGEIVIQEKIDGSQGAAMVKGDNLYFRSKGTHRDMYSPDRMFAPTIDHFKDVADAMEEGLVYYGEVMATESQNTLTYDTIPDGHFILFDIWDIENEEWLSEAAVANWAVNFGVEPAETLFIGTGGDFDSLDSLVEYCEEEYLTEESFLGGPRMEGVVIKNRDATTPHDRLCAAKIVRDDFKERNQKNWKQQENDQKTVVENIIEEQNKENRWEKVVQHAAEDGTLDGEMADLADLFPRLREDITDEIGPEAKERLWEAVEGDIFRALKSGFAEYYQERLLEEDDD